MADRPINIEIQKVIIAVFEELTAINEETFKKQFQAGYSQRNALISHVYSGYKKHEELNEKKSKWEKLGLEYRVQKGLIDIFRNYRDLYGYFPEYSDLISEIDELISTAIKKEEFEIAALIKVWRDKLPER